MAAGAGGSPGRADLPPPAHGRGGDPGAAAFGLRGRRTARAQGSRRAAARPGPRGRADPARQPCPADRQLRPGAGLAAGGGQEGPPDPALQGPGRNESRAALGHHGESGDAAPAAGADRGCGCRRPDLQYPDGRCGRTASGVHRGQCTQGIEPRHLERAAQARPDRTGPLESHATDPAQPPDGHRASRKVDETLRHPPPHSRRTAGVAYMRHTIAALVIVASLAACATTTSSTGRTQYVGAVSQEQLNQLGAQAFTEARKKGPLSTDARQNAYVRCVVDALVRQLPADQRAFAWESAVFAEKEPNAYALPGGKVGINTGLFSVAKNQDQLAAVVAHEIGHVVERHHDERITRQMGASGAVQLLGALAGDYGQLATQGGGLLAQTGFLLPGSRAQESEADVVGQRMMAQAGLDPRAAVALWQNMIAAGGNRPAQWLSTHPDPQSRISELQARATQLLPSWEQARAAGRRPSCG